MALPTRDVTTSLLTPLPPKLICASVAARTQRSCSNGSRSDCWVCEVFLYRDLNRTGTGTRPPRPLHSAPCPYELRCRWVCEVFLYRYLNRTGTSTRPPRP